MFPSAILGLSISQILGDFGYAGLGALMFAENVFPPIPSEAILPLGGYLVGRGEFAFVPVLVASTVGSVAGAALLYELARHGGRPFALRFMRVARIGPERLDQAEARFERHGWVIVLTGRWLPGVRSVVSLPAGVLRMPRGRFLALTIAGSAVWNAALIGAGWTLGKEWGRASDFLGKLSTPLVAAIVLGFAGLLLWRGMRGRSSR